MDLKTVVDSREYSKQEKIVKALENREMKILVEELDAGDYYVQGEFLVERKTPLDLLKSVQTGRLWTQAEKLKSAENVKPIILIEGYPTVFRKFTDWNVNSYHSIQIALLFGWKIPIYYTPNWRWTVDFIFQLAKKASEEGKNKIYPVGFKPHVGTDEDMIRRVVEALPYVGAKQAIELLKHFKTVKNIANASISQLKEVEGIGDKKAETIYKILNTEYRNIVIP
jgi:ERCC4-type nuclease